MKRTHNMQPTTTIIDNPFADDGPYQAEVNPFADELEPGVDKVKKLVEKRKLGFGAVTDALRRVGRRRKQEAAAASTPQSEDDPFGDNAPSERERHELEQRALGPDWDPYEGRFVKPDEKYDMHGPSTTELAERTPMPLSPRAEVETRMSGIIQGLRTPYEQYRINGGNDFGRGQKVEGILSRIANEDGTVDPSTAVHQMLRNREYLGLTGEQVAELENMREKYLQALGAAPIE